jgi:hypothetical protein
MSKKIIKTVPENSFTKFLIYNTPNGGVKAAIFLKDENIWLTQDKMALLFGVQRPAITKHLKNIFQAGELQENVVSSILEHTTLHGLIYMKKIKKIFPPLSRKLEIQQNLKGLR